MCHQRQYSLLMKIFQKVVLVLLYTKTCLCKKPFSLTQCTTPFIHLQSFLPPDVKKIWSSQLDYENPETRDRLIEGCPFTNLCGFMAIHH